MLTVARIGPKTAVPRVDGVPVARSGTVVIPKGGKLRQDVGIRRAGTASTTSITVRQAGIVYESLVKNRFVVDVLGGILCGYNRQIVAGGGVVVDVIDQKAPSIQRPRIRS